MLLCALKDKLLKSKKKLQTKKSLTDPIVESLLETEITSNFKHGIKTMLKMF